MPSTMVHILTAYKIKPDSPALFWIGNLAPDCISDRDMRETFHLRKSADRESALKSFADTIDISDPFHEGMLIHLFLDLRWDNHAITEYISAFGSDNWYPSYSSEIGLLSAWLYHQNISWSKNVWESMINCEIKEYEQFQGASFDRISDVLTIVNKYHIENRSVKPQFYTPEFIDTFTTEVAQEYNNMVENLYVRSNKEDYESLLKSIQQLNTGKGKRKDLL